MKKISMTVMKFKALLEHGSTVTIDYLVLYDSNDDCFYYFDLVDVGCEKRPCKLIVG